jgi:hypothetical protein
MDQIESVIEELEESTRMLIKELSAFSDEQFFYRPAEGSWSAGEIAEHILLLETRANEGMHTARTGNRPFDLKIIPIRNGLKEDEKKYVAPTKVIPKGEMKNKQDLLDALVQQREVLKNMIRKMDLSLITEFRHPVIGSMSRLEWVYFHIYHTERHVRQLKSLKFGV